MINTYFIQKALELTHKAHLGQFRKNKPIPYIYHPLQVYKYLVDIGEENDNILCAALLHDVLEDSQYGILDIAETTNWVCAEMVNRLTHNKSESKEEYIQRIISHDDELTSAILKIKIVDRICNIRDFLDFDTKYAKKYAVQTFPLFKVVYKTSGLSIMSKLESDINILLAEMGMIITNQYNYT